MNMKPFYFPSLFVLYMSIIVMNQKLNLYLAHKFTSNWRKTHCNNVLKEFIWRILLKSVCLQNCEILDNLWNFVR